MSIDNMARMTAVVLFLTMIPIYSMEKEGDRFDNREGLSTTPQSKDAPKNRWPAYRWNLSAGGIEYNLKPKNPFPSSDYFLGRKPMPTYEDVPIKQTDDGAFVMQRDHLRYYCYADGRIVILNESGYAVNDSDKHSFFLEQIEILKTKNLTR